MKSLRWTVAFGLAAAALAVSTGSVQAEIVASPPGTLPSAQVSVALDNDWQFDDSTCLIIPVLVTYGRADSASILGEFTVTKVGSTDTANEGTFLVLPGDPVSGQLLDGIFVCPADGTGQYTLETTIRAIEPTMETSTTLDPVTFWVRPAESTFTRLRATSVKGGTVLAGRASAGSGAATGIVILRYREPGSSTWTIAEEALLEKGAFRVALTEALPPRTQIRATLTSCSWCSRVTATTRVR